MRNEFYLPELALVSRVSCDYDHATPNPSHPAWEVFVRETISQFRTLLYRGWKFSRTPRSPYASTDEMFQDTSRKRLRVYSEGQNFSLPHPLSRVLTRKEIDPAGVKPPLDGWNVNEIFRAVHDVNGHWVANAPFETFWGEMAAYYAHKSLYSEEALPALYSETVGQLCYYYSHEETFVPIQTPVILPVRV